MLIASTGWYLVIHTYVDTIRSRNLTGVQLRSGMKESFQTNPSPGSADALTEATRHPGENPLVTQEPRIPPSQRELTAAVRTLLKRNGVASSRLSRIAGALTGLVSRRVGSDNGCAVLVRRHDRILHHIKMFTCLHVCMYNSDPVFVGRRVTKNLYPDERRWPLTSIAFRAWTSDFHSVDTGHKADSSSIL